MYIVTASNWLTCPACKKPWRPWHGSVLKTHAACHFPPEKQDEIAAKWERPTTTLDSLATEHGVSRAIIRATVHASLVRRGLPGLRR